MPRGVQFTPIPASKAYLLRLRERFAPAWRLASAFPLECLCFLLSVWLLPLSG
ncbi:hypothetical protein CALCODRAFT_498487 [Calocera cornea HHB12733]|uniref:Uncharacterized protein n=1 Tax=Calocera cornea HHB12733 TaxID=1353952 RepID=A0A165EV88_9BASI|nr:hypothetical protein CALCODRAFT_498487 [Calocera cornea HHB12733]